MNLSEKEIWKIKMATDRHFSYQWKMFSTYKDLGYNNIEEVKQALLQKTNTTPDDWKNKKVFEAGCGIGLFTLAALELGAKSVTAVDIARGAVQVCKQNTRGKPVKAYVCDVTDIPEDDESFDASFSVNCLHHIPEIEKAIKELSRITKTGGWVAFNIAVKQPPEIAAIDEGIRKHTTNMCPRCLLEFAKIIVFLDSIPEIRNALAGKVPLSGNLVNAYDHYGFPYTKGYTKEEVIEMCEKAGLKVVRIDDLNQTFCIKEG